MLVFVIMNVESIPTKRRAPESDCTCDKNKGKKKKNKHNVSCERDISG